MSMRSIGLLLLAMLLAAKPSQGADADYVRDVRPILQKHCYSCHGSLRQKSGLRLDHVNFMREGGDRGAALTPKADESLLIGAVAGTLDFERMPLDAKPLSDEEMATLRAWVDQGATAPDEPLPADPRDHWSYQKPVRAPLPEARNPDWNKHPIDRLMAASYDELGLTPSPPAPKNVLLRRVYLDLIGLPPTPEQLRAFIADSSPDAYERVVDSLLASPHYGERWGRHWMDVWRYSDWDGYAAEVRESQPHIWRWRDWIIESLNTDKPYDQMVRDMLAADELSPSDPDALRATGFLVRNWYKFNRNVWLEGVVEHTSKALLGVTLNCARCHDHMYDPILQTDYYQFRALFEPHDVRADRIRGQSDTKLDGLARVYDSKLDAPTHLFIRGNEARPDKEHPLSPAVPKVLGGEFKLEPVALRPTEYYPGLQSFVRQEVLTEAQTRVDRGEAAIAKAATTLAEARKKLAETPKQTPAPAAAVANAEQQAPPAATPSNDEKLRADVAEAEAAATLAEQEMLTASANLVAVRAKLAADDAAFAAPPAANAKELARDAARAERVFNCEQARQEALRLERELTAARALTDDKGKKKAADLETRLTAARKTRDEAQAALGQPSESYSRFTPVYPATSSGRRAALARWVTSKDNPLTARVAINHTWLRHFGSPLVPTVFDFGLAGKKPTHPKVLDWLAVELMDQSWRTKPIHRLIVTSAAYRMQSSSVDASNLARDPENVYLWRMNTRRMEAEVVRDSALHVAGALDETMFGAELDQKLGLTVPRRSVYFRSSKEKKVPFLETFDSPNVTDCYRRSETIVPQQALAMVNSSLTIAQARRLAADLAKQLQTQSNRESHAVFVGAAFERILCRPATSDEVTTCLDFLESQSRKLADPASLASFTTSSDNPEAGGASAVKPSDDPNARARENLVHVLLNHNDFVTVR
jgi:hypothetical protein